LNTQPAVQIKTEMETESVQNEDLILGVWFFIFHSAHLLSNMYWIWLVFSVQTAMNGILLPKLFWPTVRKKCSSNRERTLEIRGWRPRICKTFEITRTIYSNSERSEQFLVTECFFNLFLEVSHL
jgi:hypothetical protein